MDETVSVRLREGHVEIMDGAIAKKVGPFRDRSSFIRHLIERYREETDVEVLTQQDRDRMLKAIYKAVVNGNGHY